MKPEPLTMHDFGARVAAALDNRDLHCYAVLDCAQDPTLLARFAKASISTRSMCLLPAATEAGVEDCSPHLVELSPLAADTEEWPDFVAEGARSPASFTLMASTLAFDDLWTSLAAFTEIILPDGTEMIFAFWDPAILGTLTGQASDSTLHVPGPVLSVRQRARLMQGIDAWWYWDRSGMPQQVSALAGPEEQLAFLVPLPLKLTQIQVDMLVEAGMPDQLLAIVRENQPLLLLKVPAAEQYPRMAKHLIEARRLGLEGMRDITNYTCAALIYGRAMYANSDILALLQRVKEGELNFDAALALFPGAGLPEW